MQVLTNIEVVLKKKNIVFVVNVSWSKRIFYAAILRYALLEIYADILDGMDIYWGVSPVLSQRSVSYWRNKNNVIFPKILNRLLSGMLLLLVKL